MKSDSVLTKKVVLSQCRGLWERLWPKTDSPLILFLRLSSLNLFIGKFVGELKSQQGTYAVDIGRHLYFEPFRSLPLVEIIPFRISTSVVFLQLTLLAFSLGCVFVFFKPRLRLGYVFSLFGLFAMTFLDHTNSGVHFTAIYFILFLLLAIRPPRLTSEEKVRKDLITALALMYLFSSLNKIGAFYLSGEVITKTYSELMRWSLLPALEVRPIVALMVFGGMGLELMAFFFLFSKLRRIGLAAAILFHLGVGATIVMGVNMSAYALILPLLFKSPGGGNLERRLALIWGGCLFGLLLTWRLLQPQFDSVTMNWTYDIVSWGWLIVAGFLALNQVFKDRQWSVPAFSWLGFLLPVAFLFSANVFSWPEPLGYTQYAGKEFIHHGAIFREHGVSRQALFRRIRSRWMIRYFVLNDESVVGLFPTQALAELAIEGFCSSFPKSTFVRILTPPLSSSFQKGGELNVELGPLKPTSAEIRCVDLLAQKG